MDHLVILLSDLDAGLPFYQTLLPLLGFRRDRDHVYRSDQGLALDLRQAGDPERGHARHAPGVNHLGFTVADHEAIDAIAAKMADAGFDVPAIQAFDDGHALFLPDGDGLRFEISCYRSP